VLRGAPESAAEIAAINGEWWIVDIKSTDDSLIVLREGLEHIPSIRVIQAPKNGGFGYGNNQIINRVLCGEIVAEYIYFINPDAIPESGAIRMLVSYLDEHPSVGVVGTALVNEDGSHTDSMFRFPSFWSEVESAISFGPASRMLERHRQALSPLNESGPVGWVAGTSFMVRADVFRSVGGFDEEFFLYWEEVELCHRIAKAGYAIHGLPAAKVRHVGGVSTGLHDDERRIPAYWHESRNLYFKKTGTASSLAILNAVFALAYGLRRAIQLIRRKPRTNPHFLKDHIMHAIHATRARQ
jgi:GT2 family glycosyltransferase